MGSITVEESTGTVTSSLDVSAKFNQLMQDSLSDNSLYTRAKDTYLNLFESLNISESEKAQIVAQNITNLTTNISNTAMQTALAWSKEERDGHWALSKTKQEINVLYAQRAKLEEEIDLVLAQTSKTEAEETATLASSTRDNGKYDADLGTVSDSGLKYEQTKQVQAATYQTYADAYRKSGQVDIAIGTDGQVDFTPKANAGMEDGYTAQQTKNAERQRVAYEDSKANHAANSAAAMIGQLLSSETLSADNAQDIDRWRTAMDRLLTKAETMSEIV